MHLEQTGKYQFLTLNVLSGNLWQIGKSKKMLYTLSQYDLLIILSMLLFFIKNYNLLLRQKERL